MKPFLNDAMRAATKATRAGNLAEATRLIQSALSGTEEQPAQRPEAEADKPAESGSRIDRNAEILEPEYVQPRRKARADRPRRPISDVIRSLREGAGRFPLKTPPLGTGGRSEAAIPDGARFISRTAADGRACKLYIPSTQPCGLVVMLHGCKQNPGDFATGTGMNAAGEAEGFLVAYPEQTQQANPSACWNWFDPGHQARGTGEPESLARMTRALLDEFKIDSAFAAGLSAGGAMAALLGSLYPELYRGVGVHSGLAPGSASDVVSAFSAMRGDGKAVPVTSKAAPVIIFQGGADMVVHASNAESILSSRGVDAPDAPPEDSTIGGRRVRKAVYGQGAVEFWRIEGAGHAWSGGRPAGSFTDPTGPDASQEMMRFFVEKGRRQSRD